MIVGDFYIFIQALSAVVIAFVTVSFNNKIKGIEEVRLIEEKKNISVSRNMLRKDLLFKIDDLMEEVNNTERYIVTDFQRNTELYNLTLYFEVMDKLDTLDLRTDVELKTFMALVDYYKLHPAYCKEEKLDGEGEGIEIGDSFDKYTRIVSKIQRFLIFIKFEVTVISGKHEFIIDDISERLDLVMAVEGCPDLDLMTRINSLRSIIKLLKDLRYSILKDREV